MSTAAKVIAIVSSVAAVGVGVYLYFSSVQAVPPPTPTPPPTPPPSRVFQVKDLSIDTNGTGWLRLVDTKIPNWITPASPNLMPIYAGWMSKLGISEGSLIKWTKVTSTVPPTSSDVVLRVTNFIKDANGTGYFNLKDANGTWETPAYPVQLVIDKDVITLLSIGAGSLICWSPTSVASSVMSLLL